MATYANNTNKLSLAMPTTYQHWCEDVQVGQSKFPLHKIMLVAKSNYIKRLILESEEHDFGMLDLSNVPGGADIFDKLARFCYGVKVDITVNNVAALHCAAKYLEMTEECCEHNLVSHTHGFLTQVALTSLTGAITVLNSCEGLLPVAQQVNIVNQCVEAVSVKACEEADSPSLSPPNWWAEELTNLNITFFQKIITSMKPHNPNPLTIASAIQIYAKRSLPDIKSLISNNSLTSKHKQKEILNSIVALLPAETQIQQASFPINFLCSLLRLANFLQNNYDCKKKLEKLISPCLEHVTVDDLLILCDVESVRRMVIRFMEREKNKLVMVRVAKTVDAYLHEISKDAGLSILQFNGIASLVPKNVREVDDDLYGAIDIYLQDSGES
ncbi:putative BTB/POZ domain, NPH3 domain, NPH3/RPT2-like family protein [Helianthus annuus]|nr:putative BTB/POZ domain, NPH3 domain, NPH3/RPT2-like family protein [Helianthus annuus]